MDAETQYLLLENSRSLVARLSTNTEIQNKQGNNYKTRIQLEVLERYLTRV